MCFVFVFDDMSLQDILRPPSKDKFNDVYLVYELMDTDLHQIIRSSQPLTNEHFHYFIYQVCPRSQKPMRGVSNPKRK